MHMNKHTDRMRLALAHRSCKSVALLARIRGAAFIWVENAGFRMSFFPHVGEWNPKKDPWISTCGLRASGDAIGGWHVLFKFSQADLRALFGVDP